MGVSLQPVSSQPAGQEHPREPSGSSDELTLLKRVEQAARSLREPAGYDGGATSSALDAALEALDEWRQQPKRSKCVCTGRVVHDEFTYCPVHD